MSDPVAPISDDGMTSDAELEAIRGAVERDHLAAAPAESQTIKVADLIDNTATISVHDPHFWRVYRREKLALLDVLTRGDAALVARARELCAGK